MLTAMLPPMADRPMSRAKNGTWTNGMVVVSRMTAKVSRNNQNESVLRASVKVQPVASFNTSLRPRFSSVVKVSLPSVWSPNNSGSRTIKRAAMIISTNMLAPRVKRLTRQFVRVIMYDESVGTTRIPQLAPHETIPNANPRWRLNQRTTVILQGIYAVLMPSAAMMP